MRHNLPPGRNSAPTFDKPAPPPSPPKTGAQIEPACVVLVGSVEHPVHTQVAAELNRLRMAAMGALHLIAVSARARDEALDLLAEILGPTEGPMTLPSAAALEAWSNRARQLLAQREAERKTRTSRQVLPIVGTVAAAFGDSSIGSAGGGFVDPSREG